MFILFQLNNKTRRNNMYTCNLLNNPLSLGDMVNELFNETADFRKKNSEFPYIDLYEGNDTIRIRAIVPGIKSEDLNLEISEKLLTIEGEKKDDFTENKYLKQERVFGSFKKSVKLPYSVDPEKINARLEDGILHISLIKSEEAKPRKIEIK